MRAMRFASVLGFEIEKETHDALLKNAWLLKMFRPSVFAPSF